MNYTSAHSPVWATAAQDSIALIVDFERQGEIPFAACQDDPEPHGRELFVRAVAGDFGPIAEYVPEPTPEPTIPQSVTPAQGLMALYALKSITEDDILAAIANIEDPALRYQAQVTYNKATTWQRTSVSIQAVAGLLALTEPDLDELFTLAATYTNL